MPTPMSPRSEEGSFTSALTFGAVNSDRVECGNPASLTDLNPCTCCAWIYNTSTASATRDIWGKGSPANIRHMRLSAATNRFGIVVIRATSPLNVEAVCTNFPAYGLNKWLFFVGQYDTGGANGDQRIYIGDLVTPPAEPSSYQTQTVGAGSVTSDAASNFCIGNQSANNAAWVGRIASIGIWNRLLTPGEFMQQYHFGRLNGGQMMMTPGCVLLTLLGANGAATRQMDWSGLGNHGTVTGATYTPFGVAAGGR